MSGTTIIGRAIIGEAQLIPHCPSCSRLGADFRCSLCHGRGYYMHCTQCDAEKRDKHDRGHRVMLGTTIDCWICDADDCFEASEIELLEIQGLRSEESEAA